MFVNVCIYTVLYEFIFLCQFHFETLGIFVVFLIMSVLNVGGYSRACLVIINLTSEFCFNLYILSTNFSKRLWNFSLLAAAALSSSLWRAWLSLSSSFSACIFKKSRSSPDLFLAAVLALSLAGAEEEEATTPPAVDVRFAATTRGGLIECCPRSAVSMVAYHCQVAALTPLPPPLSLMVGHSAPLTLT